LDLLSESITAHRSRILIRDLLIQEYPHHLLLLIYYMTDGRRFQAWYLNLQVVITMDTITIPVYRIITDLHLRRQNMEAASYHRYTPQEDPSTYLQDHMELQFNP